MVSRLLFPAPPPSYSIDSFPGELLLVPRSLNPQTSAVEDFVPLLLLRCPGARFLVLVLHANSEDIGQCRPFCVALRKELGVHVLAAEYPGYGVCPGSDCDEQSAVESAEGALRFVREVLSWPAPHILVLGRSVGTGPAVHLASKHADLGGLVLVAPFMSVREVCRETLGGVAASFVGERFPNLSRMPSIWTPCLMIHGQRDSMIPVRHGQTLFNALPSGTRRRFVSPAGLDHNVSLIRCRAYLLDPMLDFFNLPQHCAPDEDLQLPTWATTWRPPPPTPRLAPGPAPAAAQPKARAVCGCMRCVQPKCTMYPLGACGPQLCNGTCAGGQQLKQLPAGSLSASGFVEATIFGAVEHISAVGYEEAEQVDLVSPTGYRAESAFDRGLWHKEVDAGPFEPVSPASCASSAPPASLGQPPSHKALADPSTPQACALVSEEAGPEKPRAMARLCVSRQSNDLRAI